ncbi:MAG: LPS assembly lipoprotein LptE [Alkalilacustris sp.]
MWWSDRRRLILGLAALPLAGCGFTPALAPGAPALALRGRIWPDPPGDRPGVAFVDRLESRFGPPTAPGWRLGWSLQITPERRGPAPGVGETRGQMIGRLSWTLTPEGAETPILQGQAERFAGYARTTSPLAIRAAAEDARLRVAEMLADALAAELIVTAGTWARDA